MQVGNQQDIAPDVEVGREQNIVDEADVAPLSR